MANELFQELLTTLKGNGGTGASTVMEQMPPCNLGKDKLKRVKIFQDWLRDVETKMNVLDITEEKKKNFLQSCAGHEGLEFWNKEARVLV